MMEAIHKIYMRRALSLAKQGCLHVSPNPRVGCVIVHKGKIIGEGYHTAYGTPHAEVNAIEQLKDKQLLKESDLYVSLEPCAHHGKTPPCADLLIAHSVPRVYIAALDPNPKVAGKGVEKLQSNGCQVEVGLLEKEAIEVNKRFFCFHQKKRPYIILKWAQTLDGFLDRNEPNTANRQDYWITNTVLRCKVHQWRAEEDAVLVGANTLIYDNPQLNVRYCAGKDPVRITWLDRETDRGLHFFDNSIPTLVFNTFREEQCGNIYFCKLSKDQSPARAIMDQLYTMNIQSVLIEGGQRTLQQFLDLNLWDEAHVLVGDMCFGGGLPAPRLPFEPDLIENKDGNKILWYQNQTL
ncbi:MAG: bifunctional diaminohydroxyphosphoribosylaminopyrimidine deaminase/5-amino-6-(5-phosphoribosylamino)uracil reductase RibD [Bacteroidales bacterium]|nr:bifunctional diaminohydroxyphosphoribosylaminopyrimidine deaminase/5-amino-6-(5-phosphoribosylamino)uracil reductase RibD [Bacteroidales bacterium]